MTVTTVHKIPSTLPHAHLYLDDVEEICKILLSASSKTQSGDPQPTIRFSIGDELRMDSIEDLQQRGGSAKEFTIEIMVGYSTSEVSFNSFLNPRISLYTLSESEGWATYGKLKAIFNARRYIIKNAIVDLPGWLKSSLYLLTAFGIYPLLGYTHARSFVYVACVVLAYMVFLGTIAFVMYRPSRVSFVRSHDRSKQASEVRRGYLRDVFMIVVGGVVGKLIEHYAARWFK